jgi:hypothetical protein
MNQRVQYIPQLYLVLQELLYGFGLHSVHLAAHVALQELEDGLLLILVLFFQSRYVERGH